MRPVAPDRSSLRDAVVRELFGPTRPRSRPWRARPGARRAGRGRSGQRQVHLHTFLTDERPQRLFEQRRLVRASRGAPRRRLAVLTCQDLTIVTKRLCHFPDTRGPPASPMTRLRVGASHRDYACRPPDRSDTGLKCGKEFVKAALACDGGIARAKPTAIVQNSAGMAELSGSLTQLRPRAVGPLPQRPRQGG